MSYLLLAGAVLLESWERCRTSAMMSLLRPMVAVQLGATYLTSSFLVHNPCCRWEGASQQDRALPILQSIWCMLFPASATFVIAAYVGVTRARKHKGGDAQNHRPKSQVPNLSTVPRGYVIGSLKGFLGTKECTSRTNRWLSSLRCSIFIATIKWH